MVRINGLGRDESVTALIRRNSDRMPPRLNICSIDVLDDTRYSEVVDASRGFVFWMSLQHSVRNFGSHQVIA
jgi:hypothetical protein